MDAPLELETSVAESGSPNPSVSVHAASNRFYRPELDVVRFLAFLLVFVYHFSPRMLDSSTASMPKGAGQIIYTCLTASGFGLSLFFTLSAYLICELLIRERETTGTVLVKQFYIRRILRIWPLYFAGLAIGLVIAILLGGRHITFIWTAWAAILLGNWFVFFRGYPGNVMFHLWSISVEEQFYLFAPWAIKGLNRRLLYGFGIVLIVFANLWLFFLGNTHAPDSSIWCNSFVQFENFAAGMLLCLLLRGRSPRIKAWLRLVLLGACACCWYYACHGFHVHSGDATPGSLSLVGGYGLVALGCCFLLVAFLGLHRELLPGWATYLGRISYGLYVFHPLALHFADKILLHYPMLGSITIFIKGVTSLGMTILFASLSYRYFESPFLRMKKHYEVITSRPV